MVMKKLIVLIIVFLSGCAAGNKIPSVPIEHQREYAADFDKVWSATISTLTEMNFPINTVDKTSGLINTGNVTTSTAGFMESAHFYAERGFLGSTRENASVNILIKTVGNKTIVKLVANIQELGNRGWFNAQSKGVLEKIIYDKIQDALIIS